MGVALGGVSRVGGDVVTARPHAPRHLAVVRKRLATSLPRRRETGNKHQPLTCRRHPDNATYTRSPIRIGRLFFLYVEAESGAETLREALASRRLQLLLVIYVVCGFQDFLVATHMVAFALDEGVSTCCLPATCSRSWGSPASLGCSSPGC